MKPQCHNVPSKRKEQAKLNLIGKEIELDCYGYTYRVTPTKIDKDGIQGDYFSPVGKERFRGGLFDKPSNIIVSIPQKLTFKELLKRSLSPDKKR